MPYGGYFPPPQRGGIMGGGGGMTQPYPPNKAADLIGGFAAFMENFQAARRSDQERNLQEGLQGLQLIQQGIPGVDVKNVAKLLRKSPLGKVIDFEKGLTPQQTQQFKQQQDSYLQQISGQAQSLQQGMPGMVGMPPGMAMQGAAAMAGPPPQAPQPQQLQRPPGAISRFLGMDNRPVPEGSAGMQGLMQMYAAAQQQKQMMARMQAMGLKVQEGQMAVQNQIYNDLLPAAFGSDPTRAEKAMTVLQALGVLKDQRSDLDKTAQGILKGRRSANPDYPEGEAYLEAVQLMNPQIAVAQQRTLADLVTKGMATDYAHARDIMAGKSKPKLSPEQAIQYNTTALKMLEMFPDLPGRGVLPAVITATMAGDQGQVAALTKGLKTKPQLDAEKQAQEMRDRTRELGMRSGELVVSQRRATTEEAREKRLEREATREEALSTKRLQLSASAQILRQYGMQVTPLVNDIKDQNLDESVRLKAKEALTKLLNDMPPILMPQADGSMKEVKPKVGWLLNTTDPWGSDDFSAGAFELTTPRSGGLRPPE